jgi:NADPH-dependent 2,4-dienoyl-CoA reductase/sulfur reductase-like enzyme
MKVIIVGGVAGGAGTAARLRRNDEAAEIIMLEKGPYISFANCGLPYYIGGEIEDKDDLLLQTPISFNDRFNVDVRVNAEVTAIDTKAKTVNIKNGTSGEVYIESYDVLVLSPGARPIRPAISGRFRTPTRSKRLSRPAGRKVLSSSAAATSALKWPKTCTVSVCMSP